MPNPNNLNVIGAILPERTEDLTFLKALVEKGNIKPAIERSCPPEQIAQARGSAEKGHKNGNVVITLGYRDKT